MNNKIVKVSDLIAPIYHKNFNSNKLHQCTYGGRSSFKSSKNEVKTALMLLQDETAEMVVLRQNYKDHKNSTFAGLKIGFDRLGYTLKHKINYPSGNDLYIKLQQGNYVHFYGMGDIESLKGIRPQKTGNKIKLVWLFEVQQFKSEVELQQAIATFIRDNKDYIYFIYEWNPPAKSSHWLYEWLTKMKQRNDVLLEEVHYTSHSRSLVKKWVGELGLKEIETLKELDREQYNHIYLGKLANLAGAIYKAFDINKHAVDISKNEAYTFLNVGVDYGETDATAFTLTGIKKSFGGIDILETYYHKNAFSRGVKRIDNYLDDFFNFCKKCYEKYSKILHVYIDTSNKSFIEMVKHYKIRRGVNYIIIRYWTKQKKNEKERNAVTERINLFNLALARTNFVQIDKSCKQLIKAIEEAEWDKEMERLDDGSTDVDSLDSMEYSFVNYISQLKQAVLRGL